MSSSAYWDRNAYKIETRSRNDSLKYDRKVAKTRSWLRSHMQVLEVGCGSGDMAIRLSKFVTHIRAVDFSNEMIEIASVKSSLRQVENVDFKQEDLTQLSRDHRLYDAVICHNVLHLLKDLGDPLDLLFEHVNPGGVLICSAPCFSGVYRLAQPFCSMMTKPGWMPKVGFFSKYKLKSQLKKAGFTIVDELGLGGPDVFLVGRKKNMS